MPLISDANVAYIAHFIIRCAIRLKKKGLVFVKAGASDNPDMKKYFKGEHGRERIRLEVLRGLAVPKLIELSPGRIRKILGIMPASVIIQEFIWGMPLHEAGLSPQQLLGAWFFAAEQFVAIRRHQLLYSDVKCPNVLAATKPLRLTLVDFDRCVPLTESGIYNAMDIGRTSRFQAPEHSRLDTVTESTVVYQLGMMLVYSCTRKGNEALRVRGGGLDLIKKVLAGIGAAPVFNLVVACLSTDPAKRPKDYEAVLRDIRRLVEAGAAQESSRVWSRLRQPYASKLSEVHL